jgi:hypothetical protein
LTPLRALLLGVCAAFLGCGISVQDVGHERPGAPPAATIPGTPPKSGPISGQFGGGEAPASSWRWLNPQPVGNSLRAMWGVSNTDAWIVGDAGTILHWDGAAWQRANVESIDDAFYGVYAGRHDDVWVAGRDAEKHGRLLRYHGGAWTPDTSFGDRQPYALWGSAHDDVWLALDRGDIAHFDGQAWRVTESPTGALVREIWGSSRRDVWAVGDAGSLAHFDGTYWTRVSGLDVADPAKDYIGVWGSAANDVWAVYQTASPEYSNIQGRTGFVHWDGVALRVVQEESSRCDWTGGTFGNGSIPDRHGQRNRWEDPVSDPLLRGHRVWGTGPDHILAVGGIDACPFSWDGTRWQIDVVAQLRDRYWGSDFDGPALWANGDDLWVVASGGRLMRHDRSAPLVDRSSPSPTATSPRFVDIFGGVRESFVHVAAIPGGAWATTRRQVYRYGPGGWAPMAGAPTFDAPYFNALHALSDHDAWLAVNQDIYHFDGASWTMEALPAPRGTIDNDRNVYALWASGPDDIWAARGLQVLRRTGGAWREIPLPDFVPRDGEWEPQFSGIGGTGPNDVWLAAGVYHAPGPDCVLYHWDGVELKESFRHWLIEGGAFPSVWASAEDDVWVMTTPAMHWNGRHWRALTFDLPQNDFVFAPIVWGTDANDLWFLSLSTSRIPKPVTRILHWDGTNAKVAFASSLSLYAISGDADGNVWAVGSAGATVHLAAPAQGPAR